jgi:hypothetical protein
MIYTGTINQIDTNIFQANIFNLDNNLVYNIIGDAADDSEFKLTYTQFICDQLGISDIDWQ